MKIALHAKNKLSFVQGISIKPADEDSEAFLDWSYVDSMVISWLMNEMSKELELSVDSEALFRGLTTMLPKHF